MSEATPPVVPADNAAVAPSAPVVEAPVSDAQPVETTAESTPAPADPVSESHDEDAPQPGRRNRAQERIEELAQTNKYLREHNEFLRDALSRGLKPAEAPPAPAPVVPAADEAKPMPTLESCGYDVNKHAEELAAWTKAEIKRGVAEGLTQRDQAVVAQQNTQSIQEAANEFRKNHADFDVALANPALQWTPTILGALEAAGAESPALGYHLAHNPDKLAKIARQSPQLQLLALGRIQAELAVKPAPAVPPLPTPTPPKVPAVPPKAPAPKKANTTNAPPPPNPVGGSTQPDIDPMTLSGTEWAKWRRQQLADKRAAEARSRSAPAVRRNF